MSISISNKDKKPFWLTFPFPQILIAVGLVMCLAPVVMHLYLSYQAGQNVSQLQSELTTMDEDKKAELLEQAHRYNNALLRGKFADENEIEIWTYDKQLKIDNNSTMAWIEIPKIKLKLLVYHGVTDEVLMSGVGHQPEFSLPVGGSAHVVLSAHSGLKQQRMFDGIRALDEGDVFAIWTLGDPYAYRVDKWEIVEPDKIQIKISESTDEVTLITCTTDPDEWNPKGAVGINDKRLLIHATRCEYNANEFDIAEENSDLSVYINDNTKQAWAAGCVMILLAIALIINNIRHRKMVNKSK